MIPLPQIEDMTSLTGILVTGSPVSWTKKGPMGNYTENVAAVNINSDLILFKRSSFTGGWMTINLSSQTGSKIIDGLTHWQYSGIAGSDQYLAGRNHTNDLVVFRRKIFFDTWDAENVSTNTGKKVLTSPVSWVKRDDFGIEGPQNLAALGTSGELLVFSREHNDWEVVDVTAKTGKTVVGEVASWIYPAGDNSIERLAGISPDGSLLLFWRSSVQDWLAFNLSAIAGGGSITSSRPVGWVHQFKEYIAVCGQNQRLLVYWGHGIHWSVVDVTEITGVKITDIFSVYYIGDNRTVLIARGIDGSLLQFWLNYESTDPRFTSWQVFNYSQAAGVLWTSRTTTWLNTETAPEREHIAAVTPQNHLVMAWDFGGIRRITDRLSRPFQAIKRQHARRNIIVILWDPHRPTHPAPSVTAIENLIFGPTNSVRGYFLENSGGKFTIERTGLFGWFPASRPPDYWWGPPDTTDSDGDGWVNPHVQKWAEAIRLADPQFDYGVHDKNPFDGDLRPDELGVLIVIPQNGPFGTNRGTVGREFPNPQPLVVDGTTIRIIAETYIGNPPNLGIVAHELAHLFLDHGNMDFNFQNPYGAGPYSVMAREWGRGTHIDPFAKLKFGWLRPQLIARSGHYSLPSIETEQSVWILMNPAHSIDEYYIVENRWRGTSYDNQIPDVGGLVIWHIMENPAVYGTVSPPPGITPQQWSQVAAADWPRRAIRLLRPLVVIPVNDAIALRDGADPVTGFDVLSNDPNPQHSSLKWADGTPSGFTIKNISPAGQVMTADINVPW